ncbi:gliding motility-associated C-terminal domain-containing protein [Tenacibaculum finnmarkense genomovar ulcerans]|uniref:T9SS type B sorting domain-containing protein n=1 Tax=Tenacibaculum finnmarkense TaxID=2781243 RepID=UPI001EFAE4B8|nr:gliding motility-associated C-terminal domain-containing protein [Tenacibaculum finnmarkense]MCG8235880.1 gliding motility-associated C-terminal domain-containing protein [Tenacibaculum finnmarkense genomovar ulcerans]
MGIKTTHLRNLIFIVLLFCGNILFSQTVSMESPCDITGCSAKDVEVEGVFIGDINGNPITVCTVGQELTNVYLYVDISKASSKKDLYMQFYLMNGINQIDKDGSVYVGTDKISIGISGSISIRTYKMFELINYTCGDTLTLESVYLSWQTPSGTGGPGCAVQQSKCAGANLPPIDVQIPIAPNFTMNTSCGILSGFQDVTFTNTSTGGNGNLNYVWNFGVDSSPATATSEGSHTVVYTSGGAKTVTLTVTDQDGDFNNIIKNIIIDSTPSASIDGTNVRCKSGNNGVANLTVTGGKAPFTYLWNNNSVTEDINNLVAGNYSVIITDANDCQATASITINEPDILVLEILKSDLSCAGNDGGIDLTVTGGTQNYTYLWSNGATTEDVSNLIAGTYSVTVTDGNGCTKTISTTLISIDTESPTITVPETLNIEGCDKNNITSINSRYAFSLTPVSVDVISFVTTGYSVNDDGDIATITYKDEITSDDGCIIKVLRTFTVTDTCGKTGTDSILITVKDTIKPDFTTPNDVIIYADSTCNFDSSVAKTGDVSDESDNCDTTLNATFIDVEIAGICEGEKIITRTWNLTDDCGNSTEKIQKITVKDTIKPTFTVPNDAIIYADENCNFDLSVEKTGDVSDESDNCDTTLSATFTDATIAGSCEGEKIITRTWNLTDDCGNLTEKIQKITVKDIIKPTFTVPNDITIFTDASCNFDSSVAKTGDVSDESDNCSTGLKATFTDVEKTGTCEGTKIITRTWNLTDSCGNSTQKDQIITVEDNIKPTFTAPKDITISTDKNCSYDVSKVITGDVTDEADNCSTGLKATFTDVEIAGNCDGSKTITRTWNLTDSCGNSIQKDQIITVEDNIKPTFTAPKDITISTDKNCNYDVSKAITGDVTDEADNCSTGLKATFTDVEKTGTCEGTKTITRTWILTDSCGNSTQKDQIITVEDNIKPTFTAPKDITISTDANCDFDVSVAKTGGVSDESDNCSTGLKATFTDVEKAGTCEGTKIITRTWILTDDCGNSTQKVQKITVKDNIKPTFTVPNDAIIYADSTCNFDSSVGKTGDVSDESDNCDTTLSATFTDATIAGRCEGEKIITRTWNLTDDCGNSTEKTQKITVKDTIKPILVSSFEEVINVKCDAIPEIPTLEFSDNCSENSTQINYEENNMFDGTDSDYKIVRTWTVTDGCGNIAEFIQTINVTVKTVATRIADSKCNNDGIINLNDYIIDNTALSGKWKVTQGDVFLSDEATFDPSNTTLGDYVFTYTISNEGCLKATEITININDDCMVLPCGQDDIKISKAVTPNGDSWNQFFEISGTESCGFVVNVKIFNRWGAKVFESNDYRNNWNGVSNGSTFGSDKILPTGTYYYIVLLENSGLKPFTGAIFLGTK